MSSLSRLPGRLARATWNAWMVALASCGGDAFTVATADGGSTTDAAAHPDAAADALPEADAADSAATGEASSGLTVAGNVVDALLAPMANVTVRIGSSVATTDAAGHFTLTGITLPYEIWAVTTTASGRKHAYAMGLASRLDPTLQLLFDSAGTARTATLTGTASTGSTPDVAGVVFADMTAPAMGATANFVPVGDGKPSFMGAVAWSGDTAVSATLYDLQWLLPSDGGLPTAYIAYASTSSMLTSGQTTNWTVPASTTLGQGSLPLSVSVSGGYALADASLYVRPAGATIAAPIAHAPAPTNPVTFNTPAISGATFVACAVQGLLGTDAGANTPYGAACNAGLSGSQGTTVEPPLATVLINPPSTAGLLTAFSWSGISGGVNLIAFEPSSGSSDHPAVYVVTLASTARIPDLSPVGLALPSGATYLAAVYGFAPFLTLASAMGPSGFGGVATAVRLGQGPAASGQFAYGGSVPFKVQ